MRPRANSFFSLRSLGLCIAASGVLLSCNLDNAGDPPPPGDIYLPAGLLLSESTPDEAPRFLYVVNSNFDLRYNSGSLQAFDLSKIDEAVQVCADEGRLGASSCEIDPTEGTVLADEVFVPSLATFVAASSDHKRIYVTTRTETYVAVVDVDELSDRPLSCGGPGRVCDKEHTSWRDPIEDRNLQLPREAVGIAAGPAMDLIPDSDPSLDGQFLLVAHRGGQVSAFLDNGGELLLQDVLQLGGRVPLKEPTAVMFDPLTRLAYVTIFARDVPTLSDKKVLARVGVASSGSEEFPSTLYDAGVVSLEGVSLGRDTRALTLNPLQQGEALVVGRSPSSLLWVDLAATQNGESQPTEAIVKHTVSVGRGPNRVITGTLGDRTVAIVSCFDSRQIFILDAATSEVLSVVNNFSGPFELGLDSARKRLYVADFRSSVVRILDVAPIVDGANEIIPTARIIATLGFPKLVQELQ